MSSVVVKRQDFDLENVADNREFLADGLLGIAQIYAGPLADAPLSTYQNDLLDQVEETMNLVDHEVTSVEVYADGSLNLFVSKRGTKQVVTMYTIRYR